MLTCCAVKRLLTILERNQRKDRKVKTAIYCAKTADVEGLLKYARQFIDDETYISHYGYKFDYDEEDVYIEKLDDYSMLNNVITHNYEIVFMLSGEEDEKLKEIVEEVAAGKSTVFYSMDCKLRAYRYLATWNQPKKLKKKEV